MINIYTSAGIAALAGILLYGGLALIGATIVVRVSAKRSRVRVLPQVIVMLTAWPVAIMVCVVARGFPPFNAMPWGAADELFWVPFFFTSLGAFFLLVVKARRRAQLHRRRRGRTYP